MVKLYTLSGLPRAGSTVLSNLLAQNPCIEMSSTSSLFSQVEAIRSIISSSPLGSSEPYGILVPKVEKSICAYIQEYKLDSTKYYIDKNRAWPSNYEFLKRIGVEPKIIMMLRDLRDVFASFEKLYRKGHIYYTQIGLDTPVLQDLNALPKRLDQIAKKIVDPTVDTIRDLLARGLENEVLFVRYEDFCEDPEKQLGRIYDFTGIPWCRHDLNNIEPIITEDDRAHGMVGLHDIDTKLHPANRNAYNDILGKELSEAIYQNHKWFYDYFYSDRKEGKWLTQVG